MISKTTHWYTLCFSVCLSIICKYILNIWVLLWLAFIE
nr:MAG TPA: hypothetical protein [Caudoviricetes sp.]